MKKIISTAVVMAALAAPAVAGGLDPITEPTSIMEPMSDPKGSVASSSGGAILPVLLVLGLLAVASSSSSGT